MRYSGLTVGIPKELMKGERRVAAIPDTVKKMVAEGARVLIEHGAGSGSHFADEEYRAAGAEIVADAEQLFGGCDIVLKVKEPEFDEARGKHEIDMMRPGQYLVSFIHPASPGNHTMVKHLASRGVIALTLDGVPRISRAQTMDALTSMSTVAGYKSVLMAADQLTKFMPMVGTAVGMIRPSTVFVVGAGVAGLQAAATAKRLGAVVHAADIRPDASEQAKSVGAKIVDTGVPAELAVGKGGYAQRLSEEWVAKERATLAGAVAAADILILAALIPGKTAPVLVTEDMVRSMPSGSVIVDIAIDQGGNCALTEAGTTTVKHGVTIIGIQNIPGMLPTSSTWLFANNILHYLENLVKDGKVTVNLDDEIIASSLVTHEGKIVHTGTIEAMNAVK